MRGTPFIYQGQELGMTNCPFAGIGEYRDLASLNAWRDGRSMGMAETDILNYLQGRSRDHSRTPMQWDSGTNAGFTDGTPWIRLNPNFPDVNASIQSEDEDSVLEHYRKLVALRKRESVFRDGDFEELAAVSGHIGGYRRRSGKTETTVWCNFSGERAALPEEVTGKTVIDPSGRFDGTTLEPWQSIVSIR